MLIALLLAASIPTTSATPPPTIITIKSSPLCNAVRNVVAPTVAGLVVQDRMLRHGGALLGDIEQMATDHATGWADMENLRLERLVDKIAQNNTVVHQLLDKLASVQVRDPEEQAQVDALRKRLLMVADRQAEALNVLSGTSDSMMANELAGFANPAAAMFAGAHSDRVAGVEGAPQIDPATLETAMQGAQEAAAPDPAREEAEKRVMGSLEPVLQRCR